MSGVIAMLRARWQPLLLLAVLVLLPFGRTSELPLAIAAVVGLIWVAQSRVDWRAPASRCVLLVFGAYWLPQLLSAPDAVAPGKAWTEVAADLRYLPFLLFARVALQAADARRWLLGGAAGVVLLWTLDALLQAATGWSIGGPAEADRLSGIFGSDDLKLGGVLAVLSPLLLWPALDRGRGWALFAFVGVLTVLLLAGARAAWLMFALVALMLAWTRLPRRQAVLALIAATLLGGLLMIAGYHASERVAARLDRSAAALAGDEAALDHALSFRLPIWRAAWSMIEQHPFNGIGSRGFRHAYPQHAPADDRWQEFAPGQGAFHAHQWLLEVAAETGLLGLACWLLGIAVAVRSWWRADPLARTAATPLGVALVVMLFPLNTHYAVYSSVWGGLLIWLLAAWIPAICSRQSDRQL